MIQCERLKSSQRWRSDDGTVLNKCQKPIAVMLNLIEMFLPKSGLVVDVTCGTGTTAVGSCRFLLVRYEIPVVCICTLSLVSATSDALSSLSVHGVINLIVSLVRDTCVIGIFYSLVHTSFISDAY